MSRNDIKGWYYGWKATLRIMIFERDLYRRLKGPLHFPEDFVEAQRPGGDNEHQRWLDSFRHLKIVSRDGDDVLLSDGSSCSLASCCPPDHAEENPAPVVGFGDLDFEHGGRIPRYGSDENL